MTHQGCTALSRAIASGRKDATDFLVTFGARFKVVDILERTVQVLIPKKD